MQRDPVLGQFEVEKVDLHVLVPRTGEMLCDVGGNAHGHDLVGVADRLTALELVDIVHALDDLAPDRVLAVEPGRLVKTMKNWELAESGLDERAAETVPRTCFSSENSALRSGLSEPPVPLPFGQPT